MKSQYDDYSFGKINSSSDETAVGSTINPFNSICSSIPKELEMEKLIPGPTAKKPDQSKNKRRFRARPGVVALREVGRL